MTQIQPEPAYVETFATEYDETQLGRMSRAELQNIVKTNGYTPRDWRAKSNLIEAILEGQGMTTDRQEVENALKAALQAVPDPEPQPKQEEQQEDGEMPPFEILEGEIEVPEPVSVPEDELPDAPQMPENTGGPIPLDQLLAQINNMVITTAEQAVNAALPAIEKIVNKALIEVLGQIYNLDIEDQP